MDLAKRIRNPVLLSRVMPADDVAGEKFRIKVWAGASAAPDVQSIVGTP